MLWCVRSEKPIWVVLMGWMGEHGSPLIDTSDRIYFANDQLAVRFIEQIDFDYAARGATAA